MKKLKCTSCGANLKIDEKNQNYAYCEYCKAKYKLNEKLEVEFKLDDDMKESLKTGGKIIATMSASYMLTSIIIGFVVVAIFITIGVVAYNQTKTIYEKPSYNENLNEDEASKELKEEFDRSIFNAKYEKHAGTTNKFFVTSMIDNIITNNKTNKDHIIKVKYGDLESTNPETIRTIKKYLEEKDYEIILDYDENEYVNKITISDTI